MDGSLNGSEGPPARKRTVRNENTDKIPGISRWNRQIRSVSGTKGPFIACNQCVQLGLAGTDAIGQPYCTQQTGGLTRGIPLRAIQASRRVPRRWVAFPCRFCAAALSSMTLRAIRYRAFSHGWAFWPIPRGYRLRPVEAVQTWLAAAEISSGPVFRAVARGDRSAPRRCRPMPPRW